MKISWNLRQINWNTIGTIFSIIFSALTLIFLLINSNIAYRTIEEIRDQTVLAEKTIEEMRAQRIQSQKPVLYLFSERFSIHEKQDSYTFGFGSLDPISFDWHNEVEDEKFINHNFLYLQNTGIGPAYEIEAQWDFDVVKMLDNLKGYAEHQGDDLDSKNTKYFLDSMGISLNTLATQTNNYRYPIIQVQDRIYLEIPWVFIAYCNYISFVDSTDLNYSYIDNGLKLKLGKRDEYLDLYGHKAISFKSSPTTLIIKYNGINGDRYNLKYQIGFEGFLRMQNPNYPINYFEDNNDCEIVISKIL